LEEGVKKFSVERRGFDFILMKREEGDRKKGEKFEEIYTEKVRIKKRKVRKCITKNLSLSTLIVFNSIERMRHHTNYTHRLIVVGS